MIEFIRTFASILKPYITYKQIIALLLLATFFIQCFGKAFIVVDYYTNTKAYAEHCINKSRPQMHCNGKCQMMKKIRQQEKAEREASEKKSASKIESPLSSKSFFATLIPCVSEEILITYGSIFSIDDIVKIPRSCFHPPSV